MLSSIDSLAVTWKTCRLKDKVRWHRLGPRCIQQIQKSITVKRVCCSPDLDGNCRKASADCRKNCASGAELALCVYYLSTSR